ncbi:hypothetical protein B0T10DRAFT_534157 [Thelonectria olida]|uniref:Uncharacterized protein n=1 Tax=Thelonectria olida TaxID=1576542 RepID=A0A9P8VMW8_9HYPO|nr:hypothetical protein B0T10DRAFT_534157 [Thelonectria olida]
MPLYLLENFNTPVPSLFSLAGKIAIVTGGSRGIGLQVVIALAEAGADVAFVYHSSTEAEAISAAVVEKTGRRVGAYKSDVTDQAIIAHTINHIVETLGRGRLDIMVANAVNYDGVMWTAIPAGKVFKQQGRGNLIITASISSGLVNVPQAQAAFNASKAGWADFARVNCVSPGYVHTEIITKQSPELIKKWLSMIAGGQTCQPPKLKGLYTFLTSDASSYMTGSNMIIN